MVLYVQLKHLYIISLSICHMFNQSYDLILGCNVVSRCTTVCIRWEHPMFQSNCVVHSIKHYYITYLLICHMFTELRSHSRLHCSEQKHTYVHSRLAFTHLHRFVQAFLQPHFNSPWQLLAASGRVVQHGVHEESSVTLFQVHESDDATSGSPMNECRQMRPAW